MENLEKTYSQTDMDNITNRVRETEQKKYSELETRFNNLQELNTKLNENYDKLLNNQENMMRQIDKQTFIAKGGNESAFDDFYSLNKDNFNNINWDEMSQQKPHYFNQVDEKLEVDKEFFEIKQSDLVFDAEKARKDLNSEIMKQINKG